MIDYDRGKATRSTSIRERVPSQETERFQAVSIDNPSLVERDERWAWVWVVVIFAVVAAISVFALWSI